MITYIVLLVVFLVAMKFVIPKLNALSGHGPGGLQDKYKEIQDTNWTQIAQALNLEFTSIAKSDDPKVWQGGGVLVKGTYKGKEVELRFVRETREWSQGLKTGYQYFIDHRVSVFGAALGSWQIVPKDVAPQAQPTGHAAFDSHLALLGDVSSVPAGVLEKCAQYGWMNLKLKDQLLVFTDDYAEYYQRKHGGMSVVNMQHVVWGTSVQNPIVSLEKVVALLDFLIIAAR